MNAMPRFRFTLAEFSGALADLGVLLPLTLALASVNGLNPAAAFVAFGLAYILNAWVYRLPVPVQPLKSLAAAALALRLSTSVIAAGAWWMALVCLGLAAAGAGRWLETLFPRSLVRGIQLGLAVLLVQSAWGLAQTTELGLLLGGLVILGLCMVVRWEWAVLAMIGFGVGWSIWLGGWPSVALASALPGYVVPALADFGPALWLLVLPQVPLSLANSIYSTADAASQYFHEQARAVTPQRLLTTMGVANLAAAAWGGVPVCHGSGGLTAHFRLGARTGGAPLMLGLGFVLLGLGIGDGLIPLARLVPYPILGLLLMVVAVEHALLVRDLRGRREWLPALTVAVIAWLTRNLALGYAAGALVMLVAQAGRRRLSPLFPANPQ